MKWNIRDNQWPANSSCIFDYRTPPLEERWLNNRTGPTKQLKLQRTRQDAEQAQVSTKIEFCDERKQTALMGIRLQTKVASGTNKGYVVPIVQQPTQSSEQSYMIFVWPELIRRVVEALRQIKCRIGTGIANERHRIRCGYACSPPPWRFPT